ncbi:MAG: hypothetical protein ABIH00_00040 [Armatimonadota bacterium]
MLLTDLKRKSLSVILLLTVFLILVLYTVYADDTATQRVHFKFLMISDFGLSETSNSLIVFVIPQNAENIKITDNFNRYVITSSDESRKITGHISKGGDMPEKTSLALELGGPEDSRSTGKQDMEDEWAMDLIYHIMEVRNPDKNKIEYELNAASAASFSGTAERTISLTLTCD